MNKFKRKELVEKANDHELRLFQIEKALEQHGINWFAEEPQPKQLNQSIFNGLDEKWRFAAVDGCTGRAYVYEQKPHFFHGKDYWRIHEGLQRIIGHDYDASNWQNSLIERDIAKELLEVDLSSELTGSDLCRKMLARGDSRVVCLVSNISDNQAVDYREHTLLIEGFAILSGFWDSRGTDYKHAVPVSPATNEPLTAADAGL